MKNNIHVIPAQAGIQGCKNKQWFMRHWLPACAGMTVAFFMTLPVLSFAQDIPLATSSAPLEISADLSLEWDRTAKTYTANKNAVAKQGTFLISADKMIAAYASIDDTSDISTLTASGGVIIANPPYSAYGDLGVYDVETQVATLTGGNLKLVTPTETVTAVDSLEYHGAEQRFYARGAAKAVRGTDTLTGDVLSTAFEKDEQGKLALRQIQADGNVVITTARETVTGDKGVYDTFKKLAVMTGHVRLKQGENWVEGAKAEVDLKTGVSRLFAGAGAPRVKGQFYPKKGSAK